MDDSLLIWLSTHFEELCIYQWEWAVSNTDFCLFDDGCCKIGSMKTGPQENSSSLKNAL